MLMAHGGTFYMLMNLLIDSLPDDLIDVRASNAIVNLTG